MGDVLADRSDDLSEEITSNASTVTVDDELRVGGADTTHDDSFSDIDADDPMLDQSEAREVRTGAKVNVIDIFKMARPSKIRREVDEQEVMKQGIEPVIEEAPVISVPKPEKKSGITAKDILTGKKPRFAETIEAIDVPCREKIEEIVVEEEEVILVKSGITAKDILNGRSFNRVSPDVEVVELSSQDEDTPNNKSKSTKKKRKKFKKDRRQESMIVHLKYKPQHQRIAEIEQKIKSSISKSISAKDLFRSFEKKKQCLVTLKINPEILRELKKPELFTKGQSIPGAKSYLDLLSHKPAIIKNPIYKLKGIPTPHPTREQMHVTFDQPKLQHRDISLPTRDHIILDEIDYALIDRIPKVHKKERSIHKETSFRTDQEVLELVMAKVPTLSTDPRFSRFYQQLLNGKLKLNHDIWTNLYKPRGVLDILIDIPIAQKIKQWIENSFLILKKKTKRPNFRKQKKEEEMDDFIVDEFESGEETDDESYVPLAIISGPKGVGKSSVVHSLVEELNGYVHEVNASQERGRKDILNNLLEISTTQLVHNTEEIQKTNEFQKGVILFEDVDVLFETDRGFWSVLETLIMVSRRPIILTCSDPSCVPDNLLQATITEASLFTIKNQPLELLKDYLYLVGIVNRLDIDDDLLIGLISENDSDLRKCLTNLQLLTRNSDIPNDEIVHVSYSPAEAKIANTIEGVELIESIAWAVDIYSVADLLETNNHSLINHETPGNEVISEQTFLNEEELRAHPLPFEYNISEELTEDLPAYPFDVDILNFTLMKKIDQTFMKSKFKEFKRLTRGALTSSALFDNESYYDKSVFDILPKNKYFTDVSPIIREFARNELLIAGRNSCLLETDPAKRTLKEMISSGELIRRKFEAPAMSVLHGSLRYWG